MAETAIQAAGRATVDAFERTARSALAPGGPFGAGDRERPAEGPGWSAEDRSSHILGAERWPAGDSDDGDARTAANTEANAGSTPETILGEPHDVIDRRITMPGSGAVDLIEVAVTPFVRTCRTAISCACTPSTCGCASRTWW